MKYGFTFCLYACQIRRFAAKTSVWYDPYLWRTSKISDLRRKSGSGTLVCATIAAKAVSESVNVRMRKNTEKPALHDYDIKVERFKSQSLLIHGKRETCTIPPKIAFVCLQFLAFPLGAARVYAWEDLRSQAETWIWVWFWEDSQLVEHAFHLVCDVEGDVLLLRRAGICIHLGVLLICYWLLLLLFAHNSHLRHTNDIY